MCERDWKRARSREQVEHRVNEILDAAARLFRSVPYDGVTLQMIAKEAGFTRSNLYRYFSTKEEIFLMLYLSDIRIWVQDVLESVGGNLSPDDFAAVWTEITCRHRRLLDLTPLLTLTLERNSSEELYKETKIAFGLAMEDLSAMISKALPGLDPEEIGEFLKFYQALVSGAWPMSRYTEMQSRILDELHMNRVKVDFPKLISDSLLAYIRGVIGESRE
jgi:TetR/AcrR family transcriptional regulator